MREAMLVVERVYHAKYYEVDEDGEVVGEDGEQVDLAKGHLIDETRAPFESEYQVWVANPSGEWVYHSSFPLDELDQAVALVKDINNGLETYPKEINNKI